ncbi:MAG: manganese efflux pump MntP family protein [Ignavibacteria bacterium]|nr:manganese efflux pump MntP family protein [Ignavibacteria bacterium]
MILPEILIIALGLSMDAFAVSISAGTSGAVQELRSSVRLSFHLGLFQFLMPVIGWFIGSSVQSYVESVDHWIAFGLLSYIGVKMIIESMKNVDVPRSNPSKGSNLVILSVATSIDALAVGFSLAIIGVDIWYPGVIIGIITAILSFIGIKIGTRLGKTFGKRMEFIGGIILIAIGIKILIGHLA